MARIVLNASMKTTPCIIVNCYDIENYTHINNIAVSKLTGAFHTIWGEHSRDNVGHEYCNLLISNLCADYVWVKGLFNSCLCTVLVIHVLQ